MRFTTASLLALGCCLGAQAQDTSRDAEQITSITKPDMRYVIESASFTVTEDLSTGIGFVGNTDEDLIFGTQGKACSGEDQDLEPCLGVEFFVVLDGDYDYEYVNSVNQRWSAIKALRLESGAIMGGGFIDATRGIILNPNTRELIGVSWSGKKEEMLLFDPSLQRHAWARFLYCFRSWGFDHGDRLCHLGRIYRGRLESSARNRDRGLLGFADLRGHFLCLSKLGVGPFSGG